MRWQDVCVRVHVCACMCVCVCMWDTSYGTQPSVCDLLTHLLTHLIHFHFLPPPPPPFSSSLLPFPACRRAAQCGHQVAGRGGQGERAQTRPHRGGKGQGPESPRVDPIFYEQPFVRRKWSGRSRPQVRAACCVLCALVCVECLMFECLVLRAVVCVCCVLCAVWYCMLIQVIPVLLSQQRRPHIAHLLT